MLHGRGTKTRAATLRLPPISVDEWMSLPQTDLFKKIMECTRIITQPPSGAASSADHDSKKNVVQQEWHCTPDAVEEVVLPLCLILNKWTSGCVSREVFSQCEAIVRLIRLILFSFEEQSAWQAVQSYPDVPKTVLMVWPCFFRCLWQSGLHRILTNNSNTSSTASALTTTTLHAQQLRMHVSLLLLYKAFVPPLPQTEVASSSDDCRTSLLSSSSSPREMLLADFMSRRMHWVMNIATTHLKVGIADVAWCTKIDDLNRVLRTALEKIF